MTDIASLGIKVTTDGVTQSAEELDKLDKAGQRASRSTADLNKSFRQAAGGGTSKTIAQNYKTQREELSKLIGEIDPTIAALDKLDKQQAQLAKFRKSGAITPEDFNAYSAAIDRSRIKITSAGEAVHKFSMNNAQARRELGYLAKDLATGQYGRLSQSSLTLAANTGVMGAAFTLAGAAVLGTVGAIGAAVVAYVKGRAEATEFNKALVLTGNYAGQTSDSLSEMAKSMASYGTTQHDAAAALAEVAASGKFTASQIQLVGKAALDMEQTTGQSIQTTIGQFKKLQDEPLKAVTELNQAQHFLTTAIYEQIKALEDQGRTQEAADVATRAYAQTISDRKNKIVENLGLIEQSWRGIKNATKAAADAALDFGRVQTGQEQFDALVKKRERLIDIQKQGAQLVVNDKGFAVPIQGQIDAYTKQLAALQDARIAAQKKANKESIAQQATLALQQSDADAEVYASSEEKRKKEILAAYNKANEQIEKAMAAGDEASAKRIAQNYVKINEGINAKYADKTPSARVARIKSSPDFTLRDMELVKKQIEAQGRLDDEMKRGRDSVDAYKASLADMLATRQAQIDLQAESVGMGQKEIAQQQALIAIDQDYNRKKASLIRQQQNTTSALQKGWYQEQLDALAKYHDDRVAAEVEGWNKQEDAQANGLLGMRAAMQDFIDEQHNMAQISYNFTRQFADGFSDAFASFVSGTKSAKDAFGSFIDSMYQQAIKFLANQAIAAIFKSFSGGGGGWGSLASNFIGAFSGGGAGPGTIGAGLASGGPVAPGSFHPVNENGPELYTEGGKTYLMGGSKPGKVTPLSAGGAGGVTVVQNIQVSGLVNRTTQEQLAQRTAQRQRIAVARNG